jgi:hypothetical protein
MVLVVVVADAASGGALQVRIRNAAPPTGAAAADRRVRRGRAT